MSGIVEQNFVFIVLEEESLSEFQKYSWLSPFRKGSEFLACRIAKANRLPL